MKHFIVSKKLIAVILVLLILCSALIIGINAYVKAKTEHLIITEAEAAKEAHRDSIIVLGCKVKKDGTPGYMLSDRLYEALRLYEANAAPKILMSGDHGRKNYDEVNAMKNFALEKGLPSEDIFMDHAGFSTYDTIYRARDVFKAKKVIIVTQEFHLYRALYIAESLGLDAVGVKADNMEYPGKLKRTAREVLARNKDFVKCIFKPLPKYLGEVIPITGDGNLTND